MMILVSGSNYALLSGYPFNLSLSNNLNIILILLVLIFIKKKAILKIKYEHPFNITF